MAKKPEAGAEDAKGLALTDIVRLGKTRELFFVASIIKGGKAALVADLRKSGTALFNRAKEANEGVSKAKSVTGILTITGKQLNLNLDDEELPGPLKKSMKKMLKEAGMPMKIQFRLPNGLTEEESEEDDPEDGAEGGGAAGASAGGGAADGAEDQAEGLREAAKKQFAAIEGDLGRIIAEGAAAAAKKAEALKKMFDDAVAGADPSRAMPVLKLLSTFVAGETMKMAKSGGSPMSTGKVFGGGENPFAGAKRPGGGTAPDEIVHTAGDDGSKKMFYDLTFGGSGSGNSAGMVHTGGDDGSKLAGFARDGGASGGGPAEEKGGPVPGPKEDDQKDSTAVKGRGDPAANFQKQAEKAAEGVTDALGDAFGSIGKAMQGAAGSIGDAIAGMFGGGGSGSAAPEGQKAADAKGGAADGGGKEMQAGSGPLGSVLGSIFGDTGAKDIQGSIGTIGSALGSIFGNAGGKEAKESPGAAVSGAVGDIFGAIGKAAGAVAETVEKALESYTGGGAAKGDGGAYNGGGGGSGGGAAKGGDDGGPKGDGGTPGGGAAKDGSFTGAPVAGGGGGQGALPASGGPDDKGAEGGKGEKEIDTGEDVYPGKVTGPISGVQKNIVNVLMEVSSFYKGTPIEVTSGLRTAKEQGETMWKYWVSNLERGMIYSKIKGDPTLQKTLNDHYEAGEKDEFVALIEKDARSYSRHVSGQAVDIKLNTDTRIVNALKSVLRVVEEKLCWHFDDQGISVPSTIPENVKKSWAPPD